jgi:hypothetical protein
MAWKSAEAMQVWYTDFAGCDIYGRLDQKLDALRSVCPEPENMNMKSRLMIVSKDRRRRRERPSIERGWVVVRA